MNCKEMNPPSLSPLRERHWWVVNEHWAFDGIEIPKGFTTDLDSVPHIPGIFALFKGRSRIAALVHDYLYTVADRPRKEVDRAFLKYMVIDNTPSWIAHCMYVAVRSFGWLYYRRADGDTPDERLRSRLVDASGTCPFLKTNPTPSIKRIVS